MSTHKSFLVILPLLLIAQWSRGQYAEGVHFTEGSWSEILAKAQKVEKPIFFDAYTDWCQPCKMMDKNVFTAENVSTLLNEKFVNVKMNMEKGEGIALREQYNVFAYPTLLFMASDGSLIHRVAGYQNVEQLLEVVKTALDPQNSLSALTAKYEAGERDPEFLKMLTKLKFKAVDGSHTEVAEAYLATQDNWKSSKTMDFIYSYVTDTESKLFDFLIENRSRFSEMHGSRKITQKIQGLIFNSVEDVKDESGLDQIDALYAKVYPEQAAQLSANFRMNYYRQVSDYPKYAEAAVNYVENFPVSGDQMNDIAWNFYEVVKDKKLLKKAVKWVKKSIKQEESFFNNDTLAALYFKLGKTSKAIKTAHRAIDIAKVQNLDHSSTDKLLEMIQYEKD